MVIKQVNLETVCGVTEHAAAEYKGGGCICRQIKCGEIFADQRTAEPESACKDECAAGQNADDQFL